MSDPRKRKPSASGAPRYFSCDGSWLAELSVPDEEKEAGPDAELGIDRHKLINSDEEDFDTIEDEYTVLRARELHEEAMLKCKIHEAPDLEEVLDQRIWLLDQQLNEIFSGEFDRTYISRELNVGLIIDDKTLHGNHVEAKKNKQLMSYAVLVNEFYGITNIYVALCQPNLSIDKQLTMCHYDEKDIEISRWALEKKLEEIWLPDQLRTPNPHCDYCSFRTQCPEAITDAHLTAFSPFDLVTPTNTDRLDKIKLAKKLLGDLEAVEDRKAMAQLTRDPRSIPGYHIANGKKTQNVNASVAWTTIFKHLTQQQFLDASKLSIKKLIKPWQNAKGFRTQKEARVDLELEIADAIHVNHGERYIKKG